MVDPIVQKNQSKNPSGFIKTVGLQKEKISFSKTDFCFIDFSFIIPAYRWSVFICSAAKASPSRYPNLAIYHFFKLHL